MRNFIIITILLTVTILCKGQSLNLVPIDSANYEIIADTLIDKNSFLPDSTIFKFNSELLKICPCAINSLNGLIQYKSSSFLIKSNKCLFLYKLDSAYYIQVGQMTNKKEGSGKYIWVFSTKKIKNEIAEKYIIMTKREIEKAEIPRFKTQVIVMDGGSHTFGDLGTRKFATTPITFSSGDVTELIRFSEKLIKKNR